MWRDVRLESAMSTKADVRRPLQIKGSRPSLVHDSKEPYRFLDGDNKLMTLQARFRARADVVFSALFASLGARLLLIGSSISF